MNEVLPTPKMHKIPKVAKAFDCANSTVWALIKTGDLKTVKFGGSTRVTDDEMRRFIEARQA